MTRFSGLSALAMLTASLAATAHAAPLDAAAAANVAANSYANVQQLRTRHIALDLEVDFKKSELSGTATLELERLDPAVKEAVLDTQDLDIRRVETSADGEVWLKGRFTLGKSDEVLGAPLTIALPPDATRVRVTYASKPQASGLQWLPPAQTLGKKKPFMFSQSEAIHARSWIPLQDTPFVRATYEAKIRAPKALRVVMSAEMKDKPDAGGAWNFSMPQPIPSYLIAIAVGDIGFRATGKRTGVYAEPALLKKAAYEFGETERTLELMEQNFGPYRWGRYDILVLPPSFPFGGMENPRLTFATPTVITGDRMLVSLVSHELAHSWSGNLVTNASWNDFWLNEGFTEYLTYRLVDLQFGEARGNMERVLGLADLKDSMSHLDKIDWPLVRKAPALDPDAVFSSVPYERGALFLSWLETQYGRPAFDAFLRGWFDDHAFQSATTTQFLAYLHDKLMAQQPGKVTDAQLDAWLYQPEIPDFAVLPKSDALDKVDQARADWLAGKLPLAQLPTAQWSVHEWQHFFEGMPESATLDQVQALDARYKLSASHNAILASAWFKVAIAHGDRAVLPAVRRYLIGVGRVRLIKPLYRELIKTTDGKAWAEKVYAQARPGYNPITQQAIERALKGENGG
ncbi:MAG TPA: M1 family metallopeptidase [Nevskia sp.]|nr:M1 family metallopeptidase [Nevskia sp.]